MFAVVCIEVGLLVASWATAVRAFFLRLVNHCGRDDACWDSDDGVAEYHYHAREELTYSCVRGYVTITYCCECYYSPVDACRYVRELCTWVMTFHYIHYSADNAYKYYNKEEIDQNLCHASSDAL